MRLLTPFIFLIWIISATTTPLLVQVRSFSEFCFREDIPIYTLVKILSNSHANLELRVSRQANILFNAVIEKRLLQKSFTTQEYGMYDFCYYNNNPFSAQVNFTLAVGRRASDFSTPEEHKDYITILKSQVDRAEAYVQDLAQQQAEGIRLIITANENVENYSPYVLTCVFVIVSVLLAFIQYKFVKRHLHYRKYL